MGAVRVRFEPVPVPAGERAASIVRGRLRLSSEGPRKTLATETPAPATLTLTLGLITKLRPALERTQKAWLTLSGSLKLATPDGEARFELDADALTLDDPELSSDDDADGRPRQFIFIELDATTFGEHEPIKAPLPFFDPEVRHVEIDIELAVGGAAEAAATANDLLDKPLVRQFLEVTPLVCLDAPVDEPAEHNLSFRASLEGDPFEVERLRLDGDELVDGEDFFQAGGQVFFRPKQKPSGTLDGVLVTTDGRSFDFELQVAKTLRERMNSLAAQLENGRLMADAAELESLGKGHDADEAGALRERLLADIVERKARLLDAIESELTSDADLAAFYSRVPALPTVLTREDDDEESESSA